MRPCKFPVLRSTFSVRGGWPRRRRVHSTGPADPMQDLRPKTMLFCAVLALAIALGAVLRGRRGIRWLFAAFAADIALWYGSQSLAGFFQPDIWERVTGVLTVLLPQFAIHLFQNIVPLEEPSTRTKARGASRPCARSRCLVLERLALPRPLVRPRHPRHLRLRSARGGAHHPGGPRSSEPVAAGPRPGAVPRLRREPPPRRFRWRSFLSYLGVHLASHRRRARHRLPLRPRRVGHAAAALGRHLRALRGRLLVSTALAFSLAARSSTCS